MDITKMTLRQKIGQLMVVGFPTNSMTEEFIELVKEYKVANTILFSYNISSKEQMKKLCADVQKLMKEETGEFAFISIDQEGGVVTRLPKDSINIPGAMALGKINDSNMAYQAALVTGNTLKELGVNFNLAPVLDVNSNPQNPVIGVRSFGENAKTVAKLGSAMVKGYLDAGIMCSIKHFPGHGDTETDSHLSLPCVDKSYDELQKVELVPFVEAINAGSTAVTLAHILFPQIEKNEIPATMSDTIINEILRKDLGFKGLVISDCLEMNAIKKYFGTANGAKNAIKAGVDLVFVSHTAKVAQKTILEIENAVQTGEIPSSRIDQAVEKILTLKEKYAKPGITESEEIEWNSREVYVENLLEKSIHYTNKEKGYCFQAGSNPMFLACGAYRSTLASNTILDDLHFATYMKKHMGGKSMSFSVNPDKKEIDAISLSIANQPEITSCIMGTYNGHLNKGQLLLAKKLEEFSPNMLIVALRNPYDLDELSDKTAKIAAYEYSEQSFVQIAKMIEK